MVGGIPWWVGYRGGWDTEPGWTAGRLGTGDIVGEMAFLDNGVSSASVTAAEPSEISGALAWIVHHCSLAAIRMRV